MPYVWNDDTQKQLLLAIIHATSPGTSKWNQIAGMLGEGATYDGVRKQYAKLKNQAKEQFGEFAAAEGEAKPAKAKGKGKRAASETAADEGEEDGEGAAAAKEPAKKGRKPAAKGKGKRKGAEDGEGDEKSAKKVKAEEGEAETDE